VTSTERKRLRRHKVRNAGAGIGSARGDEIRALGFFGPITQRHQAEIGGGRRRCGQVGIMFVGGFAEFLAFFQPEDATIRNLPPKGLVPSAEHVVLLQKDGAPRIGDQQSGRRQGNFAGAVMNLDAPAHKAGITGHTKPVWEGSPAPAIVLLFWYG